MGNSQGFSKQIISLFCVCTAKLIISGNGWTVKMLHNYICKLCLIPRGSTRIRWSSSNDDIARKMPPNALREKAVQRIGGFEARGSLERTRDTRKWTGTILGCCLRPAEKPYNILQNSSAFNCTISADRRFSKHSQPSGRIRTFVQFFTKYSCALSIRCWLLGNRCQFWSLLETFFRLML